MLIEAVEDTDDLEDAEAGEGDEGDAFVGLLAPDGDDLGDEEECVADEAEAEEEGDELLHAILLPAWLDFSGTGAVVFSATNSSIRKRAHFGVTRSRMAPLTVPAVPVATIWKKYRV